MPCFASAAARHRDLARALEAHECVLSASVVEPEHGPRDHLTVEATLIETEGVPPEVLKTLSENGASLHQQPQQADAERLCASV
jgi:hypothetical protein